MYYKSTILVDDKCEPLYFADVCTIMYYECTILVDDKCEPLYFADVCTIMYYKCTILVDDKCEPLYFADVCAGPGGFSEYVLWKKKWQAGIISGL